MLLKPRNLDIGKTGYRLALGIIHSCARDLCVDTGYQKTQLRCDTCTDVQDVFDHWLRSLPWGYVPF